ncbi:MAG: hypothetical protein JXB88_19870 [Spirochaetales bacterium]|nr:hypothetical protein [Spirochaetales bacterium]
MSLVFCLAIFTPVKELLSNKGEDVKKMKERMRDYCALLSNEEEVLYNKIYTHIRTLGYRPGKEKKKSISYNFIHKTVKSSVIKFSSERDVPFLKLKFFAAKDYSEYFRKALRRTIEEFNFKYTGCYKCGRCQNTPQGYTISYNDGRTFFRCGYELIELYNIDDNLVCEINNLITIQHEYYMKKIENSQ